MYWRSEWNWKTDELKNLKRLVLVSLEAATAGQSYLKSVPTGKWNGYNRQENQLKPMGKSVGTDFWLWLTQILEDELYLPSGEVAVIDAIARGEQCRQQSVGVVDVAVEAT